MNSSLASLAEAFHSTPWWIMTGFATGLFVSCCGVYALVRALRFRSWALAEGEISESFLRKRKVKDKYGCHVYDPVVRYTYLARGTRFVADTVSPHRTSQPPQRGAMLNVYYPVGKKVTVYHHPLRPDKAILQPARWEKRLALTAVGLALLTAFAAVGLNHKGPSRDVRTAQATPVLATQR